MNVFVTGATGYIGQHVVALLAARGDAVRALVRAEGAALPPGVEGIRGDLSDETSLARGAEGCAAAVHLAAMVSFRPADAERLLAVNAEGTRRFLAAARRAGVRRAVVASSACTVGLSRHPEDVLDEESPLDERLLAHNVYLRSKVLAERHARDAAAAGFHVSIVNPTTVYGPGDARLNSGTLVLGVARRAWLPSPPGGSNVVDVSDVAEGIVAALARGAAGRRYILGGENLPFRRILETIAVAVGRRPVFVPLPRWGRLPAGLAMRLAARVSGNRLLTPQIIEDTFLFKYFSSARAARELGWRAKRPFAETAAAAWRYYQEVGLA